MAVDRELGGFVARYDTDTRRRTRNTVLAIVTGVLATILGVLMFIPLYVNPPLNGAMIVPSVVLGFGLAWLIMGGWQFRRVIAFSGEFFELHQGGIVHAYAGQARTIGWAEIVKVVDQSKDTTLTRMLGYDVSFRIEVAGGGRVVITGFTEYAEHLAGTVRQAVDHGTRPTRPDWG